MSHFIGGKMRLSIRRTRNASPFNVPRVYDSQEQWSGHYKVQAMILIMSIKIDKICILY